MIMVKFSVIIPVYNSSKYLNKCLDSLVNQKFKDIEIVVVNDGSCDNSRDIVESYVDKYDNIFLYNITNHGQSYARNYGLSKASGEYISFVDSDDYVDVDLFFEIHQMLKNKKYDIVMFGYFAVDTKDNVLFNKKYSFVDNNNVSDVEYLFADPCPWNKVYKKKFLDKIDFRLPEGIIYEDYCYIPTLINYEPSIGYVDREFYYYVYSDSSTMRNAEYKKKYEDLFIATEKLVNSFSRTKYREEVEYLVYYHFLYEGSLNFYKYKKFDMIDKISNFMMDKYPCFLKNKYVKERGKKERLLAYLFYKKKYTLIKLIQRVKGGVR